MLCRPGNLVQSTLRPEPRPGAKRERTFAWCHWWFRDSEKCRLQPSHLLGSHQSTNYMFLHQSSHAIRGLRFVSYSTKAVRSVTLDQALPCVYILAALLGHGLDPDSDPSFRSVWFTSLIARGLGLSRQGVRALQAEFRGHHESLLRKR